MPTTPRNETDPDKVLDQACAFDAIAKLCETEGAEFPCSPNSRFAAGAANSAFTCELLLKALLLHVGKGPQKGHNLLKLFKELEKADQELASRIEAEVMIAIAPTEKTFSAILGESSDAFKYWRYVYETQTAETSPQFIRVLRIALRKACRETLAHGTEREASQEQSLESLVPDER